MADPVKYLYVNVNRDIWVMAGQPAGNVEGSVVRYEGVSDELIDELRESGWKLSDEMVRELEELPTVEF